MSFMNRKMFNRNARNKLNTMGGIANFSNGGLTGSRLNPAINYGSPSLGEVNPLAKTQFQSIGDINQNVLNQLISPNRTDAQIKQQLQQKINQSPEPFLNRFLPDPNVIPKTEGEAFRQNLMTTLFPRFKKPSVSPVDVSEEKFKRLTPFGQQQKAKQALDAGIMTLPSEMLKADPTTQKILEQEGADGVDADTDFATDDTKKIIKPKPIDQSVAEEEKGIAGEVKRSDIITDDQRKKEGQLGTILPKSPKEVADVINKGTKEDQQADLKQLMQEFTQNAPKYEGLDKSLAIAKIGFAIAAGKSPDALTNIASGLEQGADMFIKDKAQKDEFNRQVRLSALQYGLGEKTKLAAEQRLVTRQIDKERRAIQNYVAGKGGVTYRGKTYAEGTDVPVRMADIYDNKVPTNLMSDSTVKALAAKAKSYNDLSKQAIKSGTATLTEIRANQEKYAKAVDSAAKAEIGLSIAEGALVKVAEDGSEILGLSGSFNTLLNQGALALGMNLKGYDKKEDLQKDFQIMLQKLIPTTLANTQSANSISNRDVDFLITAFFGPGALEGGPLAFATQDPDIMKDRIQSAMTEMRNAQRGDFATMSDAELLLGNAFAPGSQGTKTAGGFLASQKKRARELGVAPGQQAKTTFGLQSTGEKDDKGRMIFKIG